MFITQSLKRNVQLYPNKIATGYNSRKFTWAESLDRITKLAASIKRLNINIEDRIAILAHNSDRYLKYYMLHLGQEQFLFQLIQD